MCPSGRGGGRGDWPRQFGDYVKFVLYKENRDSSKAISILASMLRYILTTPTTFVPPIQLASVMHGRIL